MINAVQGCKGDGVLTHTDGTDMLALKRERDGVAALKILRKSISKIIST